MTPQPIGIAGAGPAVPVASIVAVGTAVIAALYLGHGVFVPLALAVLVSFALAPLTNRLKRLGLGKTPSVLLVVVLALTLVTGFAYLLVEEAIGLAGQLPRYEYNLRQKIRLLGPETASGSVFEQTAEVLRRMGEELDKVTTPDAGKAPRMGQVQAPRPIPVEVHEPPSSPIATVVQLAGVLAEPLATLGIMLLFIVFVLLERENLRDRVIRLFGARDVHRATEAMNDAGSRIGRYLLMQLTINLIYGVLFGMALWLIGVPSALLWGLIGVVLRFIPYIGAPISVLFPLALGMAVDAGWTMPLLTAGSFVLIEAMCAYVLEPMLFGASTGLSKVALIVATAFWTMLWGPVGLLLAAPLTACLVVIGRHVPQLEFLEVILGNRQVLTPDVKLYQRLLADDADEAADVAEEHLEQHGLLATCDEVLLPALALVAQDRARGVLERSRLQAMAEDLSALLDDLASDAGVPSAAVEAVGRHTLCLGAGSRMDELAARTAARALGVVGLPATTAMSGPGGRLRAAALPSLENVEALLVTAVGPTASGRARRILRRVRGRYGVMVPIVVGLWTFDEGEGAATASTGEQLDADEVVGRLADAAQAIAKHTGRELTPPVPQEKANAAGEPAPVMRGPSLQVPG
ncbi:AI-2E family transporter [Benzoatithermus flavus]|uniref:AI-2E family transporter n=1 Tax=Benzoatithermus flavus TaxID=3108223 RepID=A0ABU8XZA4_9PROT